jgi:hypothetical protein
MPGCAAAAPRALSRLSLALDLHFQGSLLVLIGLKGLEVGYSDVLDSFPGLQIDQCLRQTSLRVEVVLFVIPDRLPIAGPSDRFFECILAIGVKDARCVARDART